MLTLRWTLFCVAGWATSGRLLSVLRFCVRHHGSFLSVMALSLDRIRTFVLPSVLQIRMCSSLPSLLDLSPSPTHRVQPADGAHFDYTIRSPRPVSTASALTLPSSSFGLHATRRKAHVVDAVPPSPAAHKRKQQHNPPPHQQPQSQTQQSHSHQPNPKKKRRLSMAHLGDGGGGQDTGNIGGAASTPHKGHETTTTGSSGSSSCSNDGGSRKRRGLSMRDAVARTCLDSLLDAAEVRTYWWEKGRVDAGMEVPSKA